MSSRNRGVECGIVVAPNPPGSYNKGDLTMRISLTLLLTAWLCFHCVATWAQEIPKGKQDSKDQPMPKGKEEPKGEKPREVDKDKTGAITYYFPDGTKIRKNPPRPMSALVVFTARLSTVVYLPSGSKAQGNKNGKITGEQEYPIAINKNKDGSVEHIYIGGERLVFQTDGTILYNVPGPTGNKTYGTDPTPGPLHEPETGLFILPGASPPPPVTAPSVPSTPTSGPDWKDPNWDMDMQCDLDDTKKDMGKDREKPPPSEPGPESKPQPESHGGGSCPSGGKE